MLRYVRRLRRTGRPVIIVVSARAHVTDRLRRAAENPTRRSATALVGFLSRRHHELAGLDRELGGRVGDLLHRGGRALDVRRREALLSQGERLSARWLVALLDRKGLRAEAVDADRIGLKTDSTYGYARIQIARSRRAMRRNLERLASRHVIPVVTGFLGRSPSGHVATLGRGGSDYSAVALAAIVGATRAELVKRRVVVCTADPELVPEARPVRRLTYAAAEQLADSGASILHPRTIEPARAANLTIRVVSLHSPRRFTTIGPRVHDSGERCVTRMGPLAAFRLRVGAPGSDPTEWAGLISGLDRERISVRSWTMPRSELVLLTKWEDRDRTRRVARALHSPVLAAQSPARCSLLTVLGENVLQELTRLPTGALHRCQILGAQPGRLQLLVADRAAVHTVRLLHRSFVGRTQLGADTDDFKPRTSAPRRMPGTVRSAQDGP